MHVAVALGGWSVCGVWVYTGDRLPRLVGWFMDLNGEQRDMFMNGMPVEHRMIVMDYVGCARTVQVTPGR